MNRIFASKNSLFFWKNPNKNEMIARSGFVPLRAFSVCISFRAEAYLLVGDNDGRTAFAGNADLSACDP